jgi:hypothetical protein
MRVSAVEEDGLLDQPLTQHLRTEVDILLSAGRAERDVMEPLDLALARICHLTLPGVAETAEC